MCMSGIHYLPEDEEEEVKVKKVKKSLDND